MKRIDGSQVQRQLQRDFNCMIEWSSQFVGKFIVTTVTVVIRDIKYLKNETCSDFVVFLLILCQGSEFFKV